jgi:hypothetical protein
MELTFLHVADYINYTADNKLNVMGIFSNITTSTFPAVHPEMYLVTQLVAKASEYGRQFKLEIKLLNEDASQVVAGFSVDPTVPAGGKGLPVTMNFGLKLVNTKFDAPGTYQFSVLVDGDEKGTLAIDVLQDPGSQS